ncbi:heterokaryon incompatibility protein-domain-containing protein [Echria macrotheca]|uniref:Heterokaryon incompatibility protein-domain-containing protein n=1 Tax=Echria macrotheca TaxID=438768 RepID=A0AAJ0FA98_9PEZI|nr:heterokaryon incompatibility protein-domain-containing protein [Echria macrotheca]
MYDFRTMALPEFEYQPLGPREIRIIDLHPGEPGDDLMVSISSAPLHSGQHVAVSYVWGSEERPHRINAAYATKIKGVGGDPNRFTTRVATHPTSFLRITENLRSLLVNIRRKELYISLWIDAISINQADTTEKTAQVKMMREIYYSATQTVLYIGEADDESPSAFRTIEILHMMKDWPDEKLPLNLREVAHLQGPDDTPRQPQPEDYAAENPWRPFINLFNRPWFTRTWIVQEIVLSPRGLLACGPDLLLPWDTLVAACQVIRRSKIAELDNQRPKISLALWMEPLRQFWKTSRSRPISAISADANKTASQRHILTVLKHVRNYDATDFRDKIFALHGFTTHGAALGLEVDYSVSLTELYTRVAMAYSTCTSTTQPLAFLSLVDQSYYVPDLPSWVADWRRPWRVNPIALKTATPPIRGASRWEGTKRTAVRFPSLTKPVSLPLRVSIPGCRAVVIRAVDEVKCPDWEARSHAAEINRFPEPYPTTHLSYDEAFVRAVNPRAPVDYQLEGHPRQDTFWGFKAGLARGKRRDRPVYRADIERSARTGVVHLITVFSEEVGNCIPLVKNEGDVRGETEPRYTQSQLYEKLPFHYGLQGSLPEQEDEVLNRNWFISEDGFMGLVPQLARKEDVVVHLFGGVPLYVLREKEDGVWGFLGEAFVYGLMDGEVEFDMDEGRVENFVIE